MPLMQWSDRLSVGVEMIDTDHKKLVGLVNELHDAVLAKQGASALGHVLDGLVMYTKTHFGHEEAAMARYHYPEQAAHKAEHDALTKQVLEIQAKYKGGNQAVLTMQVMQFLKEWLLKHIQASDLALGRFLVVAQGQKKSA